MKKLPAMLVVVLGVASLFADDYKVFDHGRTWSLEKKTMTVKKVASIALASEKVD